MVKKDFDITKYTYLIEDGIIDYDTLVTVLSKIGDVDSLQVKSSNGSSLVIIPESCDSNTTNPVYNNVYQYFNLPNSASRIFYMLNTVHKCRIVELPLFDTRKKLKFNLYTNLAKLVSYIPDQILVWEYHLCLNTMTNTNLKTLIEANLCKFLWDIGRAIYGLHQNNVMHGDCSLDNIGIRDGNFILFDFDGSSFKDEDDFDAFENDIYKLITSLQFHFRNDWIKIKNKVPKSYNTTIFLNTLISLFKGIDFTKPILMQY